MAKQEFNLEERTAKFGESIIDLARELSKDIISRPIVDQLIRSGTSIGANYHEANGASSKKDFRNKISIAKKESEETKYWLRMANRCNPHKKSSIDVLWQEAKEFTLIFGKIMRTLDHEA